MRDRLPGYVHGTLTAVERTSVAAHLASCADCAAEVRLIEAASRAYPAPVMDIARIVRALPAPPRRAPRPALVWRAQRIAAGIGIVVIGAFSAVTVRDWSRRTGRKAQPAASPVSVPGSLASATPAATPAAAAPALRALAAVVDSPPLVAGRPAAVAPGRQAISFGGGLSDLSDDQLDTLLGELDGLDALPSVEPETHLTPILPPGDGGHGAR